jgi:hypothetical protein
VLAFGIPFLFILSKNVSWDSYIGEISYPVYLVHGFVIGLLREYCRPSALPLVVLLVTVVVSTALYLFVDRPIDRFRHKLATLRAKPGRGTTVGKKIGLAVGAAAICLTTFGMVQSRAERHAVPHLVRVVGHYNVVEFDGKFYGIAHGVPVDWQKDNLATLPGVIIDASVERVEEAILAKP